MSHQVAIRYFVSTVPGGAATTLEPAALYVPLLSFRPGAECQRECLHTHSHRGGSAPGDTRPFEVGAGGTQRESMFISFIRIT